MKTQVRLLVEKLLNRKIIRYFPHGYSAFDDMKKRLPEESFKVVFDVGANDGPSAITFVKEFTSANVYCFEPVKSTFEKLALNMGSVKAVQSFNLALGASKGTASIKESPHSRCNSIQLDDGTEEAVGAVAVTTLDAFCESHGITKIDFLKIDTEGFDLEVLKGAEKSLANRSISFLQVEAGMNQENTKHVPIEDFKSYLAPRGYVLFGIYDQQLEWSGEARLRFSNPVFISDELVGSPRS